MSLFTVVCDKKLTLSNKRSEGGALYIRLKDVPIYFERLYSQMFKNIKQYVCHNVALE